MDFGIPTTNRPNVIQQAVNTYGKSSQVDIAIEEMSELTKALLKERRREKETYDNMDDTTEALATAKYDIYEEMADVIIMLQQPLLIYGGKNEIQSYINKKISRLAGALGMEEKK